MLQASAADGTTDRAATPHCNEQYTYDSELVEHRIAELVAHGGLQPRIHRGCEFQLSFDNIDQLLQRPATYTLNGGRYLLLECPDIHVGRHTESVLERLMDAGVVPIMAHPERNPHLQNSVDRLERWVDLGCLLQVTALSITGGFGGPPRASARKLLDRGLVHVVASDTHDPKHRHPCLSNAYAAVRRGFGEDTADLLFTDNPGCIIQDLPVAGGRVAGAAPSRRLWPF